MSLGCRPDVISAALGSEQACALTGARPPFMVNWTTVQLYLINGDRLVRCAAELAVTQAVDMTDMLTRFGERPAMSELRARAYLWRRPVRARLKGRI